MRLQFLRGGSGALAGIFFAAGLDKSLDGEPHWVLTFIVLYGLALLLACLCAYSWVLIDRRKRAVASGTPAQGGELASPGSAPGYAATLVAAKRTNDDHFPRFESVTDSFGHTAERTYGALYGFTEHVLRPGQEVTFNIEASDPNGDDIELSVLTQALANADVSISNDIVTWKVREEDISDPAFVYIYLRSQRNFHRQGNSDDTASFRYRVLPRL